jgi:inhibitor of KinA
VSSIVQSKLENEQTEKELAHRTVSIPVCYGGEYGPDLEYVARHHNLTPEEVISIHSEGEYLAYMIGFAPGFPFLGGLSEKIATPRRPSPRTSIPAGSVGIAGMQTGVYPISTPGGWQLIGQTPVKLFLPKQNPPSLLQAGDIVKFEPISKEEYQEMQAKEGEK